jgi:hypothetical protein
MSTPPSPKMSTASGDAGWDVRIIEAVNAEVGLVKFLSDEGFDVADPGSGRSIKTHCPWRWLHADGGAEKAFRVYATNTAFCFAGCGFFTPTRAAAMLWDVSEQRAAKEMAARYGVSVGDVDAAVELMLRDVDVNRADLLDAMRRWVDVSFTGDDRDRARTALIRCASVADVIETADDAATWWDKSQELIRTAAQGKERPCPRSM